MQVIKFANTALSEDEYFLLISGKEEHGNFKEPLRMIKELRTNYTCCDFEYQFLTIMIRNFRRIILMKPRSIQSWIKRIDKIFADRFYTRTYDNTDKRWKFEQTNFGKEISEALAYGKLQKKVLKKFYHHNKINTCGYCNSQYTLTFLKDGSASVKFQLDHIFPKKKYPYFSISMYNLVPSCANCNLNKGDKDFWIEDFCHPYIESIGDRFKYTLSKESDLALYTSAKNVDLDDLRISITNLNDKKVHAHNELFDLEGIHGNFNDIAREILSLGMEYPESRRYELLEKYKDEKNNKLFTSKESIDRVFLRIYPEKEKRNERPLSKFIQDLARFSDFYDDK